MSNETLQKIAGPLVVAAILGAFSIAFRFTRLEEKVAQIEKRADFFHGDAGK